MIGLPHGLGDPRCDRRYPHRGHQYVPTAQSPVVLDCPGLPARRTVAQLVAERPELADLRTVGVTRHALEVAAA